VKTLFKNFETLFFHGTFKNRPLSGTLGTNGHSVFWYSWSNVLEGIFAFISHWHFNQNNKTSYNGKCELGFNIAWSFSFYRQCRLDNFQLDWHAQYRLHQYSLPTRHLSNEDLWRNCQDISYLDIYLIISFWQIYDQFHHNCSTSCTRFY